MKDVLRSMGTAKFLTITSTTSMQISPLRTGSTIGPGTFTFWLVTLRSHSFFATHIELIRSSSTMSSRRFIDLASLTKKQLKRHVIDEYNTILMATLWLCSLNKAILLISCRAQSSVHSSWNSFHVFLISSVLDVIRSLPSFVVDIIRPSSFSCVSCCLCIIQSPTCFLLDGTRSSTASWNGNCSLPSFSLSIRGCLQYWGASPNCWAVLPFVDPLADFLVAGLTSWGCTSRAPTVCHYCASSSIQVCSKEADQSAQHKGGCYFLSLALVENVMPRLAHGEQLLVCMPFRR